jgi:hypothetical protein
MTLKMQAIISTVLSALVAEVFRCPWAALRMSICTSKLEAATSHSLFRSAAA